MNFKRKLQYKIDQYLSKGTVSLVSLLFVVIIIFIFVMITIGYIISPEKNFLEYFWIGFNQTLDPGNLLGENGSIIYMIIMTISTFLGIFVMSLFISFILNGFQNKLLELSNGKSIVVEKNHTLILGWNDGIFVIVKQIILANQNQKKPKIVVLSQMKPIEMRRLMSSYVPNQLNTKIIYRFGDIANKEDLDMCSIETSRNIIILGDDFEVTRSLIGISATNFYDTKNSHVTTIFENKKNIDACQKITKGKLEAIYFKDFNRKIIAQTALQNGLSFVFNHLFDFEGDEIYFYDSKECVGLDFVSIQKGFKKSVAIGYMRNEMIYLNPKPSEKIKINDNIIVISEDDDTANFIFHENEKKPSFINQSSRISNLKKNSFLIVGYNEDTIEILKELNNYTLKNSTCKILVSDNNGKKLFMNANSDLSNINLEVILGDTTSRSFLEKNLESPDSVIIFGNNSIDNKNRDSQSLLSLLHLRDIEEIRSISLNIVVEIEEIRNAKIIDLVKVDDFVISQKTSNKLLSQVSENRKLNNIFGHLLEDSGSEIYLKPIENYIDINHKVNFYDLIDACSIKNEIPIGYKKFNIKINNGIILNPLKNRTIKFEKNDMLIVLSED